MAVSIHRGARLCECLPATPQSIARLRHVAAELAITYGASERQCDDIELAVSEAVSNVVLHAYGGHPAPGIVEMRTSVRGGTLEIFICDEGNGLAGRVARRGAGFGLSLIEQLSETLDIRERRASPGVLVWMTFAIGEHAAAARAPA